MTPQDAGVLLVVAVVVLVVLRRNLWRAIAFVAPGTVRVEVDAPADQMQLPDALRPLEAELLQLGFAKLGTHLEVPVLGRAQVLYDYAHAAERAFASAWLGSDGRPRLLFLTQGGEAGFALTADHRRAAREEPGRYLSGTLEAAPAERVFHVHQRRAAGLGAPRGELTLEGRVQASRDWYGGWGRKEVRAQNALGLLWTLGTLGMVGALLLGRRS